MAKRFDDLAQPFRMAQIFAALDVDFLAYPIFHDLGDRSRVDN